MKITRKYGKHVYLSLVCIVVIGSYLKTEMKVPVSLGLKAYEEILIFFGILKHIYSDFLEILKRLLQNFKKIWMKSLMTVSTKETLLQHILEHLLHNFKRIMTTYLLGTTCIVIYNISHRQILRYCIELAFRQGSYKHRLRLDMCTKIDTSKRSCAKRRKNVFSSS